MRSHAAPDPAQIAVVDLAGGNSANVTSENAWFKGLKRRRCGPMTGKSKDGMEVEGLLWLPAVQAGDSCR